MINFTEQDQIFLMEYIGVRMPVAAEKYKKEIVVLDLDTDLSEDAKEDIRNLLKLPVRDKFVDYINDQDIIGTYKEPLERLYDESIDDIEIVGYLIDGKQYNFIKSTEDTESFEAGKWYNFEEMSNDDELQFNPSALDEEEKDIPGVLVFFSPVIKKAEDATFGVSLQVIKDAVKSFRILREVEVKPFYSEQ